MCVFVCRAACLVTYRSAVPVHIVGSLFAIVTTLAGVPADVDASPSSLSEQYCHHKRLQPRMGVIRADSWNERKGLRGISDAKPRARFLRRPGRIPFLDQRAGAALLYCLYAVTYTQQEQMKLCVVGHR